MTLRDALRAGTRACHSQVDLVFGQFDLSDPSGYRAFLSAHARAIPAVERAVDAAGIAAVMDDWAQRARSQDLFDDMTALDVRRPPLLPAPDLASRHRLLGAVYVLEGSRMGAAFLARTVVPGFSKKYLSAQGPKGSLKAFMDRLATFPADDSAIEAAIEVFSVFERAGTMELELCRP